MYPMDSIWAVEENIRRGILLIVHNGTLLDYKWPDLAEVSWRKEKEEGVWIN